MYLSLIAGKKASSETEAEKQSPTPILEYNNKTYQSYVENGFEDKIANQVSAPDKGMKEFLSRVDVSKGDVERQITVMCRLKAKDLTSNSKKKEEKEYITYYEDWYGKN